MKVLNARQSQKQAWIRKVLCKTAPGTPPINGCGSEIEIRDSDVFTKQMTTNQMIGHTYHWRCPVCQASNYLLVNDLPAVKVISEEEYLKKLRTEIIIEIAQLHPKEKRGDVVTDIGNDLSLDDAIITSILTDNRLL